MEEINRQFQEDDDCIPGDDVDNPKTASPDAHVINNTETVSPDGQNENLSNTEQNRNEDSVKAVPNENTDSLASEQTETTQVINESNVIIDTQSNNSTDTTFPSETSGSKETFENKDSLKPDEVNNEEISNVESSETLVTNKTDENT